MTGPYDVVLHDAHLLGGQGLTEVGIRDGRIAAVTPQRLTGAVELEVGGRLVSPTFVDAHVHLDKCFTGDTSRELLDLTDYIAAEVERKRRFTPDDVAERASTMLRAFAANGVTAVRSHVDVDSAARLAGIEGVLAARQRFRGIVDVQVVAFPQLGILRDAGAHELLQRAAGMGVDAVGGHPQLERSVEEGRRHLDLVFDIAQRHDLDVDVHVDETDDPSSTFVADLAVMTMERGWQGRVNAAHVNALAYYHPDRAAQVIRLIAEAGIAVISNPTSSLLFRASRLPEPRPRGMTRVRELLAAGVPIAFGAESVKSNYIMTLRNPEPLLIAQLMAHAVQMKSPADQDVLWDMCTRHAAAATRLTDYGTSEGCRADLNVLEATNVADAIAALAPRRWVLKGGRVVAETQVQQQVWGVDGGRAAV